MFNTCQQGILVHTGVLQTGGGYKQGQNNIELMQEGATKKDSGLILITNYIIWRERCCRIFREDYKTTQELIHEALDQWRISNRQSLTRRNPQTRDNP